MVQMNQIVQASEMLKAISHPMRFAIFRMLCASRELCVSDIYSELDIEQAVASQHLKILKDKGVLAMNKQGKHAYYSLAKPNFREMLQAIDDCTECKENLNL